MPRRKREIALQAALYQGWVTLQFLLRNPEFRKDLACCYNLEGSGVKYDQTLDWWDLIQKWDLAWLPPKWPQKGPGPLSEVVRLEEEFLRGEMQTSREEPELRHRFIFRLPIEVWDPDKLEEERWLEAHLEELEEKGKLLRPSYLKPPGRFLMMRVNLSYPQDVLEEVIKLEIKKIKRANLARKDTGPTSSGKTRHRLDKANLQLQIFDLASEGEKFTEIAFRFEKPVSTVKSLFLGASRKIFSPSTPKPGHKEIPLVDFDPETHVQKCPSCKSAGTFGKMCKLARAYSCQGYKSQREQIWADVGASPMKTDGKKHKKKSRPE